VDEERLCEIEGRVEGAPPGPWRRRGSRIHRRTDEQAIITAWRNDTGTAEFIARARQDVPDLIAEVRRLRGVLDGAV
jgi:hypothetical protein